MSLEAIVVAGVEAEVVEVAVASVAAVVDAAVSAVEIVVGEEDVVEEIGEGVVDVVDADVVPHQRGEHCDSLDTLDTDQLFYLSRSGAIQESQGKKQKF